MSPAVVCVLGLLLTLLTSAKGADAVSPALSANLMTSASGHLSPVVARVLAGGWVVAVADALGAVAGGVIAIICLVVLVDGVGSARGSRAGSAPATGEWCASAVNEGWLSAGLVARCRSASEGSVIWRGTASKGSVIWRGIASKGRVLPIGAC